MASDAQIAANRANAAKSTGPRTAEGKAASSRNALKHGMTARSLVVFDETIEDFTAFHAALREDYAPEGPAEEEMVERIIMAAWCLRRAWRAEAAMIDDAALRAAEERARPALAAALSANPPPGLPGDEAAIAALVEDRLRTLPREELLAFAGDAEAGLPRPDVWPAELAPLTRYQAHYERMLQRAKAELERHRAARRREAMERAERARARAEAAQFERRLAHEREPGPRERPPNPETAERSQFAAAAAQAPAPRAAPPPW